MPGPINFADFSYTPAFYDEWPFEVIEDRVHRWDRRRMRFVPLTRGPRVAWITDSGKRFAMDQKKVVWMCYHGPLPEGMVIIYRNGRRGENRIENLQLVPQGIAIKVGTMGRKKKHLKLLPHRIKLLLELPSDADWEGLAERWGVAKGTLHNARNKQKCLPLPVRDYCAAS